MATSVRDMLRLSEKAFGEMVAHSLMDTYSEEAIALIFEFNTKLLRMGARNIDTHKNPDGSFPATSIDELEKITVEEELQLTKELLNLVLVVGSVYHKQKEN